MAATRLHKLHDTGQSPWIDYLSRDMVQSGQLQRLLEKDSIRGVTSNPTIFQKAISSGGSYDEQLRELAICADDPRELFIQLATRDVRDACDLLRRYWEEGCRGRDGYVSIEVDPTLADNTPATIDQAVRLHDLIERPNLFVKIPATKAGLPAIEEMISRGVSINATLIFSLKRYCEVAESYVRGIERLVAMGGDPTAVASVASFFISRVDVEADRRLDKVGRPGLKGKLAIANAKLAYQSYKHIFSSARWERLEAKGAVPQRCLWASTSTKSQEYRDVRYVEELIGPQTVNTMPAETIKAFQDHGRVAHTLEQGLEEAHELFRMLDEAGIDYHDVVETLEREGVDKFVRSFDELLDGIRKSTSALPA